MLVMRKLDNDGVFSFQHRVPNVRLSYLPVCSSRASLPQWCRMPIMHFLLGPTLFSPLLSSCRCRPIKPIQSATYVITASTTLARLFVCGVRSRILLEWYRYPYIQPRSRILSSENTGYYGVSSCFCLLTNSTKRKRRLTEWERPSTRLLRMPNSAQRLNAFVFSAPDLRWAP